MLRDDGCEVVERGCDFWNTLTNFGKNPPAKYIKYMEDGKIFVFVTPDAYVVEVLKNGNIKQIKDKWIQD